MKQIYKTIDEKEFETFQRAFTHELSELGIILLTDDCTETDNYELTHFIYVPRAEHIKVLIDYADCVDVDETMWRFDDAVEYLPEDISVLLYWDNSNEIYKAVSYNYIKEIIKSIEDTRD